ILQISVTGNILAGRTANGLGREHRHPRADRTVDLIAEPEDHAFAADLYQVRAASIAGFKSHRGTSRRVQPHAASRQPVKLQLRVRFGEMIVRAHLHGPLAAVDHVDNSRGFLRVTRDGFLSRNVLTGNHDRNLRPIEWGCGRSQVWCRLGTWPRPEHPGSFPELRPSRLHATARWRLRSSIPRPFCRLAPPQGA